MTHAIALTVGDVARAAGVAPSAVRFYEKHGVITATRDGGGRRVFDDSASCRIKVAKLAQRVGLTVREIAELFADLSPSAGTEEWGRMAAALVDESERRLADLRTSLAEMQAGGPLCGVVDRLG
jgi:MerR family redox-sensitive transcriptional activator SoxR